MLSNNNQSFVSKGIIFLESVARGPHCAEKVSEIF